jgi:hypothetical protein
MIFFISGSRVFGKLACIVDFAQAKHHLILPPVENLIQWLLVMSNHKNNKIIEKDASSKKARASGRYSVKWEPLWGGITTYLQGGVIIVTKRYQKS